MEHDKNSPYAQIACTCGATLWCLAYEKASREVYAVCAACDRVFVAALAASDKLFEQKRLVSLDN